MRDDVLITVALIADDPITDEQMIVERLVVQGYDTLRAELLVAFVPLGLARAVIARLQTDPPIKLSDTALIRDFARNRVLKVKLSNVPEFVAAHELGEETFLTGVIPRERFRAASGISVELNLISQALNAGKDIEGGEIAAPVLLRLAKAAGFEEWYRAMKQKRRSRLRWW